MQELAEAIRSLANVKAVRSDIISAELFEITFNGNPALRQRLLYMVVCIWRGGGGGTVVKICHHHCTLQQEASDRVR